MLGTLRVAPFRRLWLADVISLLGDWAARLALSLIVLERTGSPGWAAAVTAVSLAGYVGIGQLLATYADRRGRVPVMVVADLVRAGLFAVMLLDLPIGVVLLLAFLAGLATPPFEAARSAAIPDLVPEAQYGDALALAGISVQGAVILGYLGGGGLIAWLGAETALAVNAASFGVSALLVLGLAGTPASAPSTTQSSRASLRDGARDLVDDVLLRRAILLVCVLGLLGTVDEALLVPYADHVGIGVGSLGVLGAAIPVGTIVGTALLPTQGDHGHLLRWASVCAMVTGAAAVPLFLLEVGAVGAFVAFLVSGGMFAVSVPANVVIGTRLRRETRASAMGIVVGALMGSQALGAALGGAVAELVGPPRTIAGALALAALYSAWSAATTPREATGRRGGRTRDAADDGEADPPVVPADATAHLAAPV